MLGKSVGLYGFRSATLSTLILLAGWVLFGTAAYVIRFSSFWDSEKSPEIWEFMLPPLLIGGPMAVFDTSILRVKLRNLNFLSAVAVRLTLFIGMIIITYSIIGRYIHELYNGQLYEYILYFLILWSTGSVLLLAIRNLAEHFDRRQLLLWITGKYHKPVVEDRIFLFVDLNDSTRIAENLGHTRYFNFLSDYFSLMARVIEDHHGEVYQHVGDEVIITWPMSLGLKKGQAMNLFFEIRQALKERENHFLLHYGVSPAIKGSIHGGTVTKGEIYGKRREFIFTGDVLNTASRMQSLCKANEASLTISADLLNKFPVSDAMEIASLGVHHFRGKEQTVEVYMLEKRTSLSQEQIPC